MTVSNSIGTGNGVAFTIVGDLAIDDANDICHFQGLELISGGNGYNKPMYNEMRLVFPT